MYVCRKYSFPIWICPDYFDSLDALLIISGGNTLSTCVCLFQWRLWHVMIFKVLMMLGVFKIPRVWARESLLHDADACISQSPVSQPRVPIFWSRFDVCCVVWYVPTAMKDVVDCLQINSTCSQQQFCGKSISARNVVPASLTFTCNVYTVNKISFNACYKQVEMNLHWGDYGFSKKVTM